MNEKKIKTMLSEFLDRRSVEYYIKKYKARHIFQIHTFTSRKELIQLFRLAFSLPDNPVCLEIGSYLGASTCFLGMAVAEKNGTLYCVDTWNNETMPEGIRDTFLEFEKNVFPFKKFIRVIRKPSECLEQEDFNHHSFNLVFIDGDHSYEKVKHDFEFSSQFLAPKGIVVFHDFRCFIGVSRTLGEALASGYWRIMGTVQNLCWIARIEK